MISSPGRLLLVTRSGAVYTSANNGSSWTAVGVIGASDLSCAARLDAHDFAPGRPGPVYRSADDGATWSAVSTITTSDAVEIVRHRASLYVMTATGDLAQSGSPAGSSR